MIALKFTCKRCLRESIQSFGWIAAAGLETVNLVRLEDLWCAACHYDIETARDYLKSIGQWWQSNPGEGEYR